MKTEKDFWAEEKRINDLDLPGVVGCFYAADPCVAFEDAQPIEGQDIYWAMALACLHNGAANRLLEIGLNPKDFGIDY